MKRLLPIILAALVLLAGCRSSGTDVTVTQTPPDDAPGANGLYDPQHPVEQETAGAVKAYPLDQEKETYVDMYPVEGGVLLLSDTARLSLLTGDTCLWKKTLHDVNGIMSVSEQTLYYYMESTKTVYAMNPATLEPQAVYELPHTPMGMPVVGEQTDEIYYCLDGEIRAMRMSSGLTRMVKQHTQPQQQLTATYFGGDVLGWKTADGQHFLSAADGSTLRANTGIYALENQGETFLGGRKDGNVDQRIYGTRDGLMQQLNIPESHFVPAMNLNGALGWDLENGAMQLCFYDMSTGKCTDSVQFSGVETVRCVRAQGQKVWILTDNAIYSWQISAAQTEDATNYLGVLFTSDNPDEEGIALCKTRAQELAATYGIEICIWNDVPTQVQGRIIVGEHQPENINIMLDQLEATLEMTPALLLNKSVNKGVVCVDLVRSIDGSEPYAWYWSGGDCHIAIATGTDVQEGFLTGLGCAIDTKILGNSRDLEYWNDMNPEGFAYTYDYILNQQREMPERYIGKFFTDLRAMSYPTEDRARIFYYAITEGNKDLFKEDMLQNKLRTLCEGIREAYDLHKSKEVYPWEQYLKQSLAA